MLSREQGASCSEKISFLGETSGLETVKVIRVPALFPARSKDNQPLQKIENGDRFIWLMHVALENESRSAGNK